MLKALFGLLQTPKNKLVNITEVKSQFLLRDTYKTNTGCVGSFTATGTYSYTLCKS
jgi:hypothetical protein